MEIVSRDTAAQGGKGESTQGDKVRFGGPYQNLGREGEPKARRLLVIISNSVTKFVTRDLEDASCHFAVIALNS